SDAAPTVRLPSRVAGIQAWNARVARHRSGALRADARQLPEPRASGAGETGRDPRGSEAFCAAAQTSVYAPCFSPSGFPLTSSSCTKRARYRSMRAAGEANAADVPGIADEESRVRAEHGVWDGRYIPAEVEVVAICSKFGPSDKHRTKARVLARREDHNANASIPPMPGV